MYEFGLFLLDPDERTLTCEGMPLALTPKAFDTLLYLVRNPGRTLTKEELLKQIWPNTFVEEGNLCVNISTIRKVLGERAQEGRYIETVPGRGYRFIAEVLLVANRDESNGSPVLESHSESIEPPIVEERSERGTEIKGPARKVPGPIRGFLQPGLSGRVARLIIPAAALFLLAALIGGFFWRSQSQKTSASSYTPSIAVLPFADLSLGKDQEYFSSGLAEELIHSLAQVPGLKVVARSSSFQFKGNNEDLRTVGRKLGVANILEGSIQREGDRVHIRAELTRTDDGTELWSQTYVRKIGDIFEVEDEIAQAATVALEMKRLPSGTGGSTGARTTSPEAYLAYLQGQYFFGRNIDKGNLESALAYADQAIRLDATYAPAWVLRSYVLNVMGAFGLADVADDYRQAREDAEHAIVLSPNLAAGYLALGWLQLNHDWDWEGAEASLRRAAASEPGSVEVLRYQSSLDRTLGRQDEAIKLYRQVVALDPLRARSYSSLGFQLYAAGQYDEARSKFRRALELTPQKEEDHVICGLILLARQRPKEALTEMEQESGEVWKLYGQALAYQANGRPQDSVTTLNELIATHQKDWAYQIAEIYAYRGEPDRAFEWLNRAYQQHDSGLLSVKIDPLMKNLRQDSRYAAMLEKMRLPT